MVHGTRLLCQFETEELLCRASEEREGIVYSEYLAGRRENLEEDAVQAIGASGGAPFLKRHGITSRSLFEFVTSASASITEATATFGNSVFTAAKRFAA